MTLLDTAISAMTRAGIAHAMIGATALAAHGVARSTMDIDLLVVGGENLTSPVWDELRSVGVGVDVRRGDADDPLLGVVRLTCAGEAPIDVIVAGAPWQRRVIERAQPATLDGTEVFVASAPDLVLLKLYAGSPQDLWDVERLVAAAETDELTKRVGKDLTALPEVCREAWASVLARR